MAQTGHSDDSAITSGLGRWLARRPEVSDVVVTDPRRPSAGYSSETVIVDTSWSECGTRHGTPMVIRMAPVEVGTFRHYDLVSQWQAQMAAAAVGVPVADPEVETDAGWLGAPFMVMPLIEGTIIGAVAHLDRWLGAHDLADRGRVYRNFVATLCAIHRADPSSAPGVARRDNLAELAFWDDYLLWSSDGEPVATLVRAMDWCRRHRPAGESSPVLLWGDVRFENMIFGDHLQPLAVLDWDMTSVGAPEHDLAWFTSLDLVMHHIFGERLAGFPDRAATIDLFEEGSGRAVRDLEWYESLAITRSAAVMTRISYLRRAAGEPLMLPIDDNPILDLLETRLR